MSESVKHIKHCDQDYIQWLQQQDLSKAETFWKQALKGFTAPTPLVVARAMGGEHSQESSYGEEENRLSEAVTSALKSLAQDHELTLNSLIQGAWALLLNRYSGEEDVVFGVTRACHCSDLEGAESRVGLFINTLPLRVRVSPEMSVLSLLKELQSQWIALRDYEHIPLSKVQEWSEISDGTALFESLLVFEDNPINATVQAQDSNWENREFQLLQQTSFPLRIVCSDSKQLLLKIEYHRQRFEQATIMRMLGHLQTLLESMVANPEQRLADLPILTQAEQHQLLVKWNNTQSKSPKEVCFHQLFEAQVERTPDAIAVVCQGQQLTYWELNQRANQLAHYLRSLGVGPDVLVGICVERSLEMAVGFLGIFKAGGAYLPLDPNYPSERLAFMLEDSQAPVLLTQERLLGSLPNHSAQVVRLDTDWEVIAQQSQENPLSQTTPQNLAYVIYTSGSTGKPKGVMITHQGLMSHNVSVAKQFNLEQSDRVLQFASISFDIAVEEIFPSWISGCAVILRPEEILSSIKDFLQFVEQERVTILNLPTAFWHEMVKEMSLATLLLPASLRLVVVGGEKASRSAYLTWSQLVGEHCRWLNTYGPTETTVTATVYEPVVSERDQTQSEIPIGRPLANTQIYILDRQLQPVPIGIPGELHIGGSGVARGYLNRPDLSAEKFIRNPFTNDPDARLYKTGDLVRYLPDGNIEFVGRIDYQVKIRGFRIELGEIEAVLEQHPAVQQTVVLAREDVPGRKRLVAYLLSNPEQAPTTSELRSYLKEKLPDYMVPSAFVMLEALPLTPNGKVDRRALPAPDWTQRDLAQTFVAPRTPVEEALTGIWTEVLGVEQVGIYDNFFELGGHSLLVTQVLSRVRSTFQVELPVRCLFEAPTVNSLREHIEVARRGGQSLQVPPLQPASREGNLPLSSAQQRLWFLDQLEPGSSAYNIPIAHRLIGQINVEALEKSLAEIVQRHEALRTTFIVVDDQPIQVIAQELNLKLPIVDLQQMAPAEREEEAQRRATEEAQRPFDLATGPLLRAQLLQLDQQEYLLLVTMHHIVSDGWSAGVFEQELATLYESFCTGKPSPLPALPIQYADFAYWQQQWLQGEVLQSQLDYWKQQLEGSLPVLELPTDRPRPAVQTYRGAQQSLVLSSHLTEVLKALSQQTGTTLFMTLLAAFQSLLYRYSGQEDIIVGSPIAGRNHGETEPLIGFFVNTLVLRTDCSGNPSFRELLSRVREVTLGAYDHQDLPFEKLVEELRPERSLSYNPLFQVMFILQNTLIPNSEFSDLAVSPLELESQTAKFDLTLELEETSEGLKGWFKYNTDLFDAATITRMVGHFQTLLEGIVSNPEQRLAELPLLTPAEQHQLLVEWNNTQTDYSKQVCLHQLFEVQVERTPDALAVVFEDQQLTYRQLNSRANQLAHHLQGLGVGPEVLVGICLERSLEMIVALLSVLKAGGAYVPIDPAYPKDRLAHLLSDSQVLVLLTQQHLLTRLPDHRAQVICSDTDWRVISQQSQDNPVSGVQPENLAYVIYTSGSTGKPKGVAIEHKSIVNYLNGILERLDISSSGNWAFVSTIAADLGHTVLFPSLCTGGCLHVVSQERASDPDAFADYFERHSIDCLKIVPSHFAALQTPLHPERVIPRQRLILGGEASRCDWVESLQRQSSQCTLFNHYGPTETTVGVLTYRVEDNFRASKSAMLPLGRPIPNIQIYILDCHLQPVPIGVPGELHIGGAGLARGYLNRPELTAEKFIPNSFSDEPGARLYKTGDLVRYLPDGNIEFLGRTDHQVKIRGFRIEIGEIEAVLAQHPAVQETVIIAREDVPGDKRLVAYVVYSHKQAPTTSELRSFLKEKLPDYMVPSAFVILEALPLTPNGKVDRRALPAPDWTHRDQAQSFVAPRTPVEEELAGIWSQVLGMEKISIDDNFFELGGHSLLATQVISRIRNVFHVELPLRDLFELPTVAALGERIETLRWAMQGIQATSSDLANQVEEIEEIEL